MLLTKNFTETSAYQALTADYIRLENSHLKDLFATDSRRAEKYNLLFQDIYFDFSKNIIDEKHSKIYLHWPRNVV